MITKNISIENAVIRFRNFSGKETRYNPAGRRSFCVFLDDVVAHELLADGWNIRWLTPRDPEDTKQAYLQVFVSYKNYPPKIVLITNKNKVMIGESDISGLDWYDIKAADIIIRPYNWEVNGKEGTKAYLKTMYITIEEDQFEGKYVDAPEAAVEDFDPPF